MHSQQRSQCFWPIPRSCPARGCWRALRGHPLAMAVSKDQPGQLACFSEFVEEAKASGLVQRAIDRADERDPGGACGKSKRPEVSASWERTSVLGRKHGLTSRERGTCPWTIG